MEKARVLQVLAAMLVAGGLYMLYMATLGGYERMPILGGLGPMFVGIAIFLISKNPIIRGSEKKD
jgi:hypothetical protein